MPFCCVKRFIKNPQNLFGPLVRIFEPGGKSRSVFLLPFAVFLLALVSCTGGTGNDGADSGDVNSGVSSPAGVHYVQCDAVPGGDGTSWARAFSHPQDALDIALPGDQVWVAAGTYGLRDFEDRNVLVLVPGVSVLGGFTGHETGIEMRSPETFLTTLDGQGSAYHVVLAIGADGAVLDGFTITGGNATGYMLETARGGTSDGGGVFCAFSSLEINRCRFLENRASSKGGAIYIEESRPVLSDSIFEGNSSIIFGGALNIVASSPDIINCIFQDNKSETSGGAVNILESQTSFVNSVFSGNSSFGAGGAVLAKSSEAIFSNCTFNGNRCEKFSGGAVFLNQGRARLTNSILWGDLSADSSEIALHEGGEAQILYSIVQGGFEGTGNLGLPPEFIQQGAWDEDGHWIEGDYRLAENSPAIDSGTEIGAPNFDLAGTPRPQEMAHDRGAFEHKGE